MAPHLTCAPHDGSRRHRTRGTERRQPECAGRPLRSVFMPVSLRVSQADRGDQNNVSLASPSGSEPALRSPPVARVSLRTRARNARSRPPQCRCTSALTECPIIPGNGGPDRHSLSEPRDRSRLAGVPGAGGRRSACCQAWGQELLVAVTHTAEQGSRTATLRSPNRAHASEIGRAASWSATNSVIGGATSRNHCVQASREGSS